MLTRNLIETELSYAYLHAVAAFASYAVDISHIDVDSVDAEITAKGKIVPTSLRDSPKIQVQLKATKNADINDDNTISFPLPIKNYNDLRANTLLPRILVLFALPQDEAEWLVHHPDQLIMKKCAYYLNLKGMAASANAGHHTVRIPIENSLTPQALISLMTKASNMEDL